MKPINPFLKVQKIEVLYRQGYGQQGEMKPYYLDRAKSTHFYRSGNKSGFKHLTAAGMKLLMWISIKLQWNQDRLDLDREGFMEWAEKSLQTFYNARAELITFGYITQFKGPQYWINPFMLFHGNRAEYARQNNGIDVKTKPADIDEQNDLNSEE
jgi:hypothetical protein